MTQQQQPLSINDKMIEANQRPPPYYSSTEPGKISSQIVFVQDA